MSIVQQGNSIIFLAAFLEDKEFNLRLRQDRDFQKFILENKSLLKSLLLTAYDLSGSIEVEHVISKKVESLDLSATVLVAPVENKIQPIIGIREGVMKVLVDSTGYPEQVLTDESDLEADLGIDTVKQMEILAILAEQYHLEYNDKFKLSDVSTIKKLVAYISIEAKKVSSDAAKLNSTKGLSN